MKTSAPILNEVAALNPSKIVEAAPIPAEVFPIAATAGSSFKQRVSLSSVCLPPSFFDLQEKPLSSSEQVDEHPSPEIVFLSSQISAPSLSPSPQIGVQVDLDYSQEGVQTLFPTRSGSQEYKLLKAQLTHPSTFAEVFQSSQSSPVSVKPFPHDFMFHSGKNQGKVLMELVLH
jgi:hypothetical protein